MLIPAAGKSERLGSPVPKPLIELKGKTILQRAIEPFLGLDRLEKIVVSAPRLYLDKFKELVYSLDDRIEVIEGGETRQQSVFKGLELIKRQYPQTSALNVAIHDAARCLLKKELIEACLKALDIHSAVVPALQPVDSLKVAAKDKIIKSLDRRDIFYVQTPQCFYFDLIWQSHQRYAELSQWSFADDAAMIEDEHEVRIIPGDRENIKITSESDLTFAEALLSSQL